MSEDLKFRGYAGEVVYHFLLPKTLITVLGLIAIITPVIFVISLMAMQGGEASAAGGGLILMVIGCSLFGRFAIQASRGDFDAGILGTKIKGGEPTIFAITFIILNLAWIIPWAICGNYLLNSHERYSMGSLPGLSLPFFSKSADILRMGLRLFFLVTSFCCPSLAGIVATARISGHFESFSEILEWLWSKKSDLIPFYASLLGGAILFLTIYSIPLGYVVYLIASNDLRGGIAAGILAWMTPGMAGLILGGRMTGAFVAAHSETHYGKAGDTQGEKLLGSIHKNLSSTTPSVSALAAAAIAKNLNPSADIPTEKVFPARSEILKKLEEIKKLFQSDPTTATDQLKALVDEAPLIADSQILLVLAYTKLNKAAEAISLSPKAASLGLASALSSDVVKLFKSMKQEMLMEVNWTAKLLNDLGEACGRSKYFQGAWWCAELSFKKYEAPEILAQKVCYRIAELASEQGQSGEGLQYFKKFLELFPQSSFGEFVTKAILREEAKGSAN